jgi:hypothetical protein
MIPICEQPRESYEASDRTGSNLHCNRSIRRTEKMKPINIVTGNHGESPVHVEDIITYLASALQSGGLEVNIIPHLVYAEAHIIIECFDNFTADSILLCISTGARFILVVTEYITGNTFNDFSVDASDSEDRQYWNFGTKTSDGLQTSVKLFGVYLR